MKKITEKKAVTQALKEQKGFQKIATELGVSKYKIRAIIRNLVIENLRKEYDSRYEGGFRSTPVTKTKNSKKIAVVLSDIHIPFHDQQALGCTLAYMKDLKPDVIVLNGDIIDCYPISKFMKDPLRIETLQDEFDEAQDFMALLRKNHPKAQIAYIMGNHEFRLEKILIDKAPGLYGLRCLSLDELLGISKFKITFVDDSIMLGKLEVTHGASCSQQPGGSVSAHFNRSHRSTLIGHIHKLNITRRTAGGEIFTLAENGCLCELDADYLALPGDWQQGFTVVEFSKSTGDFEVRQCHIDKGELVVGDVRYTAG